MYHCIFYVEIGCWIFNCIGFDASNEFFTLYDIRWTVGFNMFEATVSIFVSCNLIVTVEFSFLN